MTPNTTATPSTTFHERVLARTGMALSEVPEGTPEDVAGGHIVAHDPETNTFVVFVGSREGEDEETGQEWWNPSVAARRVTL